MRRSNRPSTAITATHAAERVSNTAAGYIYTTAGNVCTQAAYDVHATAAGHVHHTAAY